MKRKEVEKKALELISIFFECPVYEDMSCVSNLERERWVRLARKWIRLEKGLPCFVLKPIQGKKRKALK